MRRVWICILVISLAGFVSAQESSVLVDLHGGTSKIMQDGGSLGALGGVGVRYQCLFPTTQNLKMGVAIGLAFDYAQIQRHTSIDRSFSIWYSQPPTHWIEYTMTGGYEESFQQLRCQLPVLLALRTHGVVVNAGMGISGWKLLGYKEQWNDPHLTVYYPDYEVTVEDADPSGILTEEDYRRSIGMRNLEWNINVIGEVGYEWKMGLTNGLGVQAFVQYGVWSTRVSVLDAGLKVYYRFGFVHKAKRHRGDCHCL